MNLTENEKRMVYQVESTCQAAILNEIAMNKRYAPNPEIRQTAESLPSKLRLLSDKECMALVNDVQKNYRLPGKARTIGEMLAEARQKSGAEKLAGHDIITKRSEHVLQWSKANFFTFFPTSLLASFLIPLVRNS